jgi:tRNA-dihydrouridine synthase B
MKIGDLNIDGILFSAPLAGISDSVFRYYCRKYGASATVTEMVSAKGLSYSSKKTLKYINFTPGERPLGIQLFAPDSDSALAGLEVTLKKNPDFIDFNCGCPVKKVAKQGAGGALLKNPVLLLGILKLLVENSPVPVTAKLRTGWDSSSVNFPEMAMRLQDIGIAAIFIHPRTVAQGFRGKPDTKLVKETVSKLSIPLVYSGDICSAGDAKSILDYTGCDGIMIGRAAMGDPHIFLRIKRFLENGEVIPVPSPSHKIGMLLEYYASMIDYFGPEIAIKRMRKFVVWYTRGLPRNAKIRSEVFSIEDYRQVQETIIAYRNSLEARNMVKTV